MPTLLLFQIIWKIQQRRSCEDIHSEQLPLKPLDAASDRGGSFAEILKVSTKKTTFLADILAGSSIAGASVICRSINKKNIYARKRYATCNFLFGIRLLRYNFNITIENQYMKIVIIKYSLLVSLWACVDIS